jgi:uncharacterized protein (TIGR02145 family)
MKRKIRFRFVVFLVLGYILILTNSCKKEPMIEYGTIIDIDGNSYKTVKIGTQEWLAENLKTAKFNDGTYIPEVIIDSEWFNLTTPGYWWYFNDASNYKDTYGALYNWYAVGTGLLCPVGWHVPTDEEWGRLTTFLGGEDVAGGKLKETGTIHWKTPNYGATNETGFTALPGGCRWKPFANDIGYYGAWWSSTEIYDPDPTLQRSMQRSMQYNGNGISRAPYEKTLGYSVRCLED